MSASGKSGSSAAGEAALNATGGPELLVVRSHPPLPGAVVKHYEQAATIRERLAMRWPWLLFGVLAFIHIGIAWALARADAASAAPGVLARDVRLSLLATGLSVFLVLVRTGMFDARDAMKMFLRSLVITGFLGPPCITGWQSFSLAVRTGRTILVHGGPIGTAWAVGFSVAASGIGAIITVCAIANRTARKVRRAVSEDWKKPAPPGMIGDADMAILYYRTRGKGPRTSEIHALLDRKFEHWRQQPCYVCLGPIDAPPSGPVYFFEPMVVSPLLTFAGNLGGLGSLIGVYVGSLLVWLCINPAGALAGIAASMSLNGLAGWALVLNVQLVLGLAWVARIAWRGLMRPTYLRFSPGLIEVVTYRWFWQTLPSILRYPVVPGTLFVLCNQCLILQNEDGETRLHLQHMHRGVPVAKLLWHSLLWKGPVPVTSHEHLTG